MTVYLFDSPIVACVYDYELYDLCGDEVYDYEGTSYRFIRTTTGLLLFKMTVKNRCVTVYLLIPFIRVEITF
jgi:hypothetical protein